MNEVGITSGTSTLGYRDFGYDDLLARVQERFSLATFPIFRTSADLWPIYLDNLPEEGRQQHNCHCCRHWFEKYAGLVTVDDHGSLVSAFWGDGDFGWYGPAVAALREAVEGSRIVGVFHDDAPAWGVQSNKSARTGETWTHFWVPGRPFRGVLKTPYQAMAEKAEDFKTLQRALDEFTVPQLEEAVKILRSDALYRSEKVLGLAEWLLETAKVRRNTPLVWHRVATAPGGACHPRSSMIGTLLEDIAAGYSYDAVAKRFAAKMHPLQYQRPTAPPKAGNIERAEEIVAKLGIAKSLERRYALASEVPKVWEPRAAREEKAGGVFGHLKSEARTHKGEMDGGRMTWEKFARTVLPDAREIDLFTGHGNYGALLTAVHADAPEIFQWPGTLSHYVYVNGSSADSWGLPMRSWVPIVGVAEMPGSGLDHHAGGVVLIIKGARDVRGAHACLFPETLKAELREVRGVIEAHSQRQHLECPLGAACGMLVSKGKGMDVRVRVNGDFTYTIDRWD